MMKFVMIALLSLISSVAIQAQRIATPEVYSSRAELVAQYQFNPTQEVELDRILLQRENNLEGLGRYTNQDAATYWSKRRSIYFGELASIRLILETPEQISVYDQQRANDRVAESERVRALIASGNSREAARVLMLERY